MHLLGGRTSMARLFHCDEEEVCGRLEALEPRQHPSLCEEVMPVRRYQHPFLTRVSLCAVLLSSFLLCGNERWARPMPPPWPHRRPLAFG